MLVNPTWNQLVESDPLVAFSWYLSGRKSVLLAIGREIVAELDAGFAGSTIDMGRVDRAESLAWLWTLGAYEVVRNDVAGEDLLLCQGADCDASP